MRAPDALSSLLDHGIIDEVVRPLMSGKEAQVYLVVADGEERIAKVYKEAQNRTFKHRAAYTEGRGVRNTRDQRALAKRSRHGKALDEEGWRSAEVDFIYRLQAAGVRVPEPFNYVDGVLVMELVKDGGGLPAPRLADLHLGPEQGHAIHKELLGEIVKMLCAGIVHGDLSEFNVLLGADGPVLIDFPQAVEAARNQSARRLLIRDVDNLGRYLCRSRRGRPPRYGQEMWAAYERGELTPDTRLTGLSQPESSRTADTAGVLAEIEDVAREAERRGAGTPTRRGRRRRGGGQRPSTAPTSTMASPTTASATAPTSRSSTPPPSPTPAPRSHERSPSLRAPSQRPQAKAPPSKPVVVVVHKPRRDASSPAAAPARPNGDAADAPAAPSGGARRRRRRRRPKALPS